MTGFCKDAFLLVNKATGGFCLLAFLMLIVVLTPCTAGSSSRSPVFGFVPSARKTELEKAPAGKAASQPQQSTFQLSAADRGEDASWKPSVYYVRSIGFEPESPVAGDPIKIEVYFEEHVKQPLPLLFQWKVNGEPVSETTDPEFRYPTKRGDHIEVVVSVGGNRDEARPVRGTVTVENSPPTVKKLEEVADEKGEYTARLESSDADGDDVILTLQKGPDGMTLDGATGELHWSIPKGTKGDFPVEVLAKDSSGGQAVFSYTITVK